MKTFAVLSQLLLLFLGVFLMIIVLLQRGRGGGLAGAFGGLGGQSAFGTKAGDVFTKITVVLAICWVLVAGGSGYILRAAAESRAAQLGEGLPEDPAMSLPPSSESDSPFPVAPAESSDAPSEPAGEESASEPDDDTTTPAEPEKPAAEESNESDPAAN